MNKRFQIALSFPGERREYVENVASALSQHIDKDQVFYDRFHEAELARINLDTFLQNIYRNESELLVVFLCADYEHKDWCQVEWRAIRVVIKERNDDEIMFVRLDNSYVSGMLSIDGYVDASEHTAEEVAALILRRHKSLHSQGSSSATTDLSVTLNAETRPLQLTASSMATGHQASRHKPLVNRNDNNGHRFLVPFRRNSYFTDRADELDQLRSTLDSGTGFQVILGLGGIGKTQMAVEFAYRFQQDYETVAWLRADGREALNAAIVEFATQLGLPFDVSNYDDAFSAVTTWCRRSSRWLLVFDNVDNPQLIDEFLPDNINGHVVVTSRVSTWDYIGAPQQIELKSLPIGDAIDFLIKRAGRDMTDQAERASAEQLAQELGCLPLALEQAGAYTFQMKGIDFAKYLDLYRAKRLEFLERGKPVAGRYDQSVATTWGVNIAHLGQAQRDLLCFTAFLAPESISHDFIADNATRLGDAIGRELDVEYVHEFLEPLHRFSLITQVGKVGAFGVHRLVQEVVKDSLIEGERQTWVERSFAAINEALSCSADMDDWDGGESMIPHLLTASKNVINSGCRSLESGRLLASAGRYMIAQGRFAEAENALNEALEILRDEVDLNHPEHARTIYGLAELYRKTERHEQSEPLYRQARDAFAAADRGPDIATTLNGMGLLYNALRRFDEAKDLISQALQIRQQLHGQRHAKVANLLNDLASVFRRSGDLQEAEKLCIQALEIRKSLPGNQQLGIARNLNTLAVIYVDMGRSDEAVPLCEEVTGILRTTLGEEHPDSADALDNLAAAYEDNGQESMAEAPCLQALGILTRVFGANHPRVHRLYRNHRFIFEKLPLPGEFSQREESLPDPTAMSHAKVSLETIRKGVDLPSELWGSEEPLVTPFPQLQSNMPSPSAPDSIGIDFQIHKYAEILERLPVWDKQYFSNNADVANANPRWLLVFKRALRHEPYCIEAFEQGVSAGLLPLSFVSSILFGKFLVSLPYLSIAPILASDHRVEEALVEEAVRLADELDVKYLELRQGRETASTSLNRSDTNSHMLMLHLPQNSEELARSFKSKLRSQIKKSEKFELDTQWGTADLCDEFYSVFSRNMRDLGTPVYSIRLFLEILSQFPNQAELCVVRHDKTPVAAGLIFHGQGGVTQVMSASSLREYNRMNININMYWSMLKRSIDRKQTKFNLGRSSLESGSYRFKRQWGAEPEPLTWQYYMRTAALNSDRDRYSRAVRIWQKLPLTVTRWLGPSIVRGIP